MGLNAAWGPAGSGVGFRMCMFTRPVRWVGSTCIFARLQGNRQVLIYSMELNSAHETAMVLPIPLAPGTESIEFVDLQGFPGFFHELRYAFRSTDDMFALESTSIFRSRRRLPVEKVGAFEASFVPTLADFAGLDERFRLAKPIMSALSRYQEFGFAVFQLRPGEQRVHPMAFLFPTADPGHLYFPTMHLHGNIVWPVAHYDHSLFCQSPSAPPGWATGGISHDEPAGGTSIRFWMAPAPVCQYMPIERAKGLLNGDAMCYLREVRGYRRNQDYRLAQPT